MKNKIDHKSIFSLIVLILLCVLFVMGYRLVAHETEVVKEMAIKNNQIKDLDFGTNLKEQSALLNSQEQQIKSNFIESSRFLGFIENIESLANQNNIEITISKVQEGDKVVIKKGLYAGRTNLELQTVGAYEDIISFVKLLSENEKNLTFNNLSMYRAQNGEIIEYTTKINLTGLILSYE